MTTPTSGTISIGNCNTEFGYGGGLRSYRYMYDLNNPSPISLTHMYNKSNTKRGGASMQLSILFAGTATEQAYFISPSSIHFDGCPWDRDITGNFIGYTKAGGYPTSVRVSLTKPSDVTFTQNYFTAFHIPGIIWLDTVNATTFSQASTIVTWAWSGYNSNPLGAAGTKQFYLER